MSPKEFREKLKRRKAAVQKAVQKTLDTAGLLISSEAKRMVQKSQRGGRTYEKYKPRRTHRASAPGEAPATDVGQLARSITYETDPANNVVVIRCAVGLAPYAMALEYGTVDGRIEPRPFMRPAIAKMRPKIKEILRQEVNIALTVDLS